MGNASSHDKKHRHVDLIEEDETKKAIDPRVLEARREVHEKKYRYATDYFESERFRPDVYAIRDKKPVKLYNTTDHRIEEAASATRIWYFQDPEHVYGPFTKIPDETMMPHGWYRVYEMMAGFTECKMKMCRYIGALEL